MGCHALLQRILPTQGSNLCLLCLVTGRLLTTSAPYTYICSFSDLFSHLGDYRILSRVPCVHSRSFLVLSFVDSNVNGTGFFVHEADSLREEGGAWNPSNPQTECSLSALLQRLDSPSPAECPRAPAQPPPAECPRRPLSLPRQSAPRCPLSLPRQSAPRCLLSLLPGRPLNVLRLARFCAMSASGPSFS